MCMEPWSNMQWNWFWLSLKYMTDSVMLNGKATYKKHLPATPPPTDTNHTHTPSCTHPHTYAHTHSLFYNINRKLYQKCGRADLSWLWSAWDPELSQYAPCHTEWYWWSWDGHDKSTSSDQPSAPWGERRGYQDSLWNCSNSHGMHRDQMTSAPLHSGSQIR